MLKFLVVSLLIVSYIDTIRIAKPSKNQVKGVHHDALWASIHTMAYGLAVAFILFDL
ncbi:hypothetical protein MHH33_03045 [Paenisporosarcina sp. FSL H8-0542]|uniref:hypothetical protein n=1 Tax=unclassified Paenisporosarcina TaxID=2642018 RepID=UPI00034E0089|nr:hypothetical protein [Paenisporosarcina sp. HGH0030]EPD50136.1 hypothetical protein HMPREF1210_02984 [Paenisporosarcina sp. HGH0030]